MRKRITLGAVVMALAGLLALGIYSNGNESAEASNDNMVVAMELKEEYYEREKEGDALFDQEFLSNQFAANEVYREILEYLEVQDDELREHFSGARIGEDGHLVVSVCSACDACQKFITDAFPNENIIFEEGIGSYYTAMQQLDEINAGIVSLLSAVAEGKADSDSAQVLAKAMPRAVYDATDNSITVAFDMTEACAKDCETLAGLFREYVACDDSVRFAICEETCMGIDEAEEWRPGRLMFVYTNPSQGQEQ